MIRIAVIDDEKIILERICELIKRSISEDTALDAYTNGSEFFKNIEVVDYDIVFLDIDLPGMSGFEVAQNLKCIRPDVTIVFVSSQEHLVFQSFEFKPFRFVRKSRLENDIAIAAAAYQKELSMMREIYTFKTNDAERAVKVIDILYFESMGHDIMVQTVDGKYKLKRERGTDINMTSLSERFEAKGFIRIHRSFLVNYKHIYVINRNNIVLKNNEYIRINPHKVNDIKRLYQHFLILEG